MKAQISCLLTLIILMVPGVLFSQTPVTAIEGVITNEKKEPLPGFAVVIENLNRGVVSNIDGKFQINNLSPGRYTLTVTGIGFKKQYKTVDVSASAVTHLDITMEEEPFQMEAAVVTGKSESTVLKEKGFAINAIETKDIELQSIQATDLLDRSAGVRVRQDGGLGSKVRYNINGLSGNSIRMFLNGIPMENYGSSFSLSSIPTSMIERIEVYKGVVPAYLGDDALGGAINVVTKTNAPNTLNFSYSIGSFNTHQANINGSFRNKNSGFTVRGSSFFNYSDNNYKVWGDKIFVTNEKHKKNYLEAERFHDAYRSAGGKFDVGFTDVQWADQFLIGMVLSEMQKEIQHGVTMEIVYGNRKMKQSTQMLHALYNKQDFLFKGLDVDLFASYSNLQRHLTDTIPYMYNWLGELTYDSRTDDYYKWASGAEGGRPTLNEDLEKVYVGRFNLSYRLNDNNRLNLNVLHTDFSRKPDDPLLPANERALIDTRYLVKNIVGFSLENESFNARLKSSFFFKYYNQNIRLKDAIRERNEVKPFEMDDTTNDTGYGFALSYELSNQIRILTSAENALRLPENQEIFGNLSENVDPAYNLKPERSTNINLGLNLGPFIKNRHSFNINTNVFYRNIVGMIKLGVPDQLSETAPHMNIDEVISTGVDVEGSYSYNKILTWTAGAAISNPRFTTKYDEKGAKYPYYQDRLRNEPFFTLNNNIRYLLDGIIQKNSKASVYYNIGYVHEFFRNWESLGGANKDIIPSQLVNDLGVSYTFPKEKVTLSLDARNIFNEQVFDNWALQKPGRAFYLKFNYKLK